MSGGNINNNNIKTDENSSGNTTITNNNNNNNNTNNNSINPMRHSSLSNLALYSGMEDKSNDFGDIDDININDTNHIKKLQDHEYIADEENSESRESHPNEPTKTSSNSHMNDQKQKNSSSCTLQNTNDSNVLNNVNRHTPKKNNSCSNNEEDSETLVSSNHCMQMRICCSDNTHTDIRKENVARNIRNDFNDHQNGIHNGGKKQTDNNSNNNSSNNNNSNNNGSHQKGQGQNCKAPTPPQTSENNVVEFEKSLFEKKDKEENKPAKNSGLFRFDTSTHKDTTTRNEESITKMSADQTNKRPSPSFELESTNDSKKLKNNNHTPQSTPNQPEYTTTNKRRISDQLSSVPPQFLEKLMNFSLFQNAPRAFYVAIARQLKTVIYHAQEYILKYGEDAKSMYWILRGSVKVTSPDGEVIHATLNEGAYFGEIGILFNRPRTATVIAETKVLVGVLTSENLNQVLPEFPLVERHIRDEAQERLAMQEKKKRQSLTKTIQQNVVKNMNLGIHDQNTINQSIGYLITNKDNVTSSLGMPMSATRAAATATSMMAGGSTFDYGDGSISIRQFLKSVPLFTTLPVDIIHGLALCVELRKYEAFDYIMRKNDIGTDIYFVVSGEVEVLGNALLMVPQQNSDLQESNNANGNTILENQTPEPNIEVLLGRLGPGQYFGEMGFLQSIMEENEKPTRTADIRAISPCHLLVLTGETLEKFCTQYPLIKKEIIKTAEERMLKNKRKSASLASMEKSENLKATIPNQQTLQTIATAHQQHQNIQHLQNLETLQLQQQQQQQQQTPCQQNEQIVYPQPTHKNPLVAHLLEDSNFPAPNISNSLEESRSPSPLQMGANMQSRSPAFSTSTNARIAAMQDVHGSYWNANKQQVSLQHNTHRFDNFQPQTQNNKEIGKHWNVPPNQQQIEINNSVQGFKSSFSFGGSRNEHQLNQQKSVSPLLPPANKMELSNSRNAIPGVNSFGRSMSPVPNATRQMQPLDLEPPTSRSVASSRSGFTISQPLQQPYMSRHARVRMNSIASRRRSSVLSVGPLPDRILLHCFEFLLLPDLMKLRLVCRRWRQLLYVAPHLFKKLDLTKWKTSIEDKSLIQISNFVGSRPKIIDISNCYHITDEGFSYMVNEIGIGGQLTKIKMVGCWEISAMTIMDLAVPSIGKNIIELDLSNCKKVQDDVIQRLFGWGKSSEDFNAEFPQKHPRSLVYQPFHANNATGAAIASNDMSIFGNNSLDFGSEFGSSSLTQMKCNVGCPNLHSLTVRHCKGITDLSLKHISQYAFNRINRLDLTRCTGITDKGFQSWKSAGVIFQNLHTLILSECVFLTDEAIFNITASCPFLKILNISFCFSITDAGLDVICFGLQQLEQLDVSFCGRAVSNASLLSISVHLKKLQKIWLKGCLRVTRSGVDSLLSGFAPLTFLDISQCKNAHVYQDGLKAEQFQTLEQGGKTALIKVESNGGRIIELIV